MRQVISVFQVSVYGLLCVSAVMLGLAEGTAIPDGITLPLAVLALIFVERRRLFHLPVLWANLLGVAVFVATGLQFLPGDVESRVLALAHLAVYLSWIVLFQKKRSPQYWWMCALSILQVAVGAVLTTSGLFAMLLAAYLILAIWTLSVFSLYQAQTRFATAGEHDGGPAADETDPDGNANSTGDSPRSPRTRDDASVLLRQPSQIRNAVQHDNNRRWISPRFTAGVLGTALLAGMVSAAFFVLIPRYWIGRTPLFGHTVAAPIHKLTGFTEDIQLGDIGEILESSERVLQVRLVDDASGRELDVDEYARQLGYDEPLFRGAVLETYQNNGHWSGRGLSPWTQRLTNEENHGLVRQEIILDPIGSEMLFSIQPVRGARLTKPPGIVGRDPVTGVLVFRSGKTGRDTMAYTVYSPQPAAHPERLRDSYRGWRTRIRTTILKRYRQFPDTGLLRLKHLAQQVAGTDDTPKPENRPSQRQMADRVVRYLRDSGRFSYSLNASVQDPSIDPVEDFLFNRKTGHCEYFASALCLMLRAVGIPARLINGFKGGRRNQKTGYFEVQQRHVHSWVEAYIDDQWLILDATPVAARAQSVESMAPGLHTWSDVGRMLKNIWNGEILHMDISRQQRLFYQPLRTALNDFWSEVRSHRSLAAGFAAAIKHILLSPDRWFSWQGGLLTLILLLVAAAAVWICRRITKLWSRMRIVTQTRRRGNPIEFYERFRRLCAAQGLFRHPSQTQQEFATDACGRLNSFLETSELAKFPAHLVAEFYHVRFGHKQLDSDRLSEINDRLTRLEHALKTHANT